MNTANPSTTGTAEPQPAPSSAPVAVPQAQPPVQKPAAQAELPLRLAIGLLGMLLASLLSILNEQVTAVALADIRGAFSVGYDDGTWLTAIFEATNVATMVFAPWFGITFTLKRFTIGAVLAVMLLGFLCPFAPNLPALYVLRGLQGVAGGCLPPMLIIVALRYLPPKIKLYGLAGYAATATLGPALGTPLAALWTEYVSWQMTFWQILPLGLLSCVAIYKGLPPDPMKLERLRSFNWTGFLLGYPAMAMFVIGFLQGDRLDWLNSPVISTLFIGGALLLVAFLINQWFHPVPFFKLQLLERRNFAHGLLTLVGAVTLLVGVASIPSQFLVQIHGYRPLQTTPLFLLLAIPLLLTLPGTAAVLNLRQVDHRWVMAIGLSLIATTCFLGSFVSSDWVRENFYWLQSLEILGQPMLIMGILMGVTTGLPPTEGPFASAMFNTVKTFATAGATGLIQGVGTAREHFHSSMLVDQLGNRALLTGESINATHSLGELAHRVHEQAVVLTSADLYLMMAGIAIAFLLVIPVLPVRIYPPWCTTPPSSPKQ
ncbi:MFS transporter [Burkholderia sp. L27(2015)]|uniref:MFS transporter n=1 Tax=Burkholderia sp. L27(2015) TaxID=1641858 RepID=UPI00131D1B45|nr:MFS transporter [Burkholderia sp. L27(2015)]